MKITHTLQRWIAPLLPAREHAIGPGRGDVAWGMGSLLLLSVCGLLLNIMIGRYYGAATLGSFSQVFAIFALLSQLAVGGLQFSVLRHVSAHMGEKAECARIILDAALLTAVQGALVCLLTLPLALPAGELLESPQVTSGLYHVLPAVWFISLNKVLMAAVNGAGRLRLFTTLQATRYLLLLLYLLAALALEIPGAALPGIFTATEFTLLLFLLGHHLRHYPPPPPASAFSWGKRHLRFGHRAFFTGLATDINTRVSILILGLFLDDYLVGIYSFASMLVDGVGQLPALMRLVVSPTLARLAAMGEMARLTEYRRQVARWIVPLMLAAVLVGDLLFPYIAQWLAGGGPFLEGWPIFVLLSLGEALAAGHTPFLFLLNQTGHPLANALLMVGIATSTALLNLLLIPHFGILGAGVATALATVLVIPWLRGIAWMVLRLPL